MPASPVLIPRIDAEQVPPSQIMTSGPFSDELTKPYFVAPQVKETGFGGPGHAILAFANNFLQGASAGRLKQFQQSEVTKKEHERNYDSAVQHIQDSPNYTQEFKEKIMQQALATKASAGIAALGKGKGGKNEHPMVGLARGVFNSIVGPSENQEHIDIGPEHVSDLMTQMHDPGNQFRLDEAVGQTGQKLKALGDTLDKAGVASKTPVYQEDLLNHQGFQEAVAPLIKQGINPAPFVQSFVNRFQPKPTAEQQLKMDTDRAQLAAAQAQGKHYEAQTAKLLNAPISWSWTGDDGQPRTGSIKFSATGEMQDLDGKTIPAGDPRKVNGVNANTGAGWTQGTYRTTDADGNIIEVPYTNLHGKGTPPPPIAGSSSPIAGVQIPPIAPGQPGVQQLAFKNNNPGNLEFRNQAGAVLSEDGRFAKFTTPEQGFQALVANINVNKSSPLTLAGYISKYAPAGENNTQAYIGNASKALGVPPETALAQIDSNKLAAFQAQQESSTTVGQPVATPKPPVMPLGARVIGKKPLTAIEKAEKESELSPEALDIAAHRFNTSGGELPAGYGPAATVRNARIMNRAAVLDPKANISSNKANFESFKGALAKTQSQAALVNSFENTGERNLDIALANSDKVDRTGSPVINRYLLKLKGDYKGDTDTALFENAVMTAATEYARVISSLTGQTAKDVRDETRAMLNTAMSKGTFPAVVSQMKQEMGNRRTGYDIQIKELQDVLARGPNPSNKVTITLPNGGTMLVAPDQAAAARAAIPGAK